MAMQTIPRGGWHALRAIASSEDELLTDSAELLTYELDGSLGLGQPQGVFLPRTTEQVVSVVRWANAHNIPIIPRGAGTGLSGGALASQGGIVLAFARMKQIVELDEVGRSAVIQPGIVHLTFDEFVKTKGLYYPPDPASGRACTLGGNLGENAGGPHCFKYGVTTNYVTGLKVVLADGRVIVTGGRALDYPEYDFTGLLVGSEGTLGIITEAYVRLLRNVPGVKTLMAIFDSVEQAGEAVSAVIARGLVPATLEMMDRQMIGIVENYTHAGLPTDAEALLIIEADGYPEGLDAQMEEIVAVLRAARVREMRLAKTAAEREQIWYARKSAFGAIAQISPAYLIVDGTVPRSKLAATLAEINRICAALDLRVGYVFHAGDGNLHPLILFDPNDAAMVERVHRAGQAVMELCVRQGGTITGEHGVGSEKVKYIPLMFSPDELRALRDIKQVFDPRGLLNPGKIIPEVGGQGAGDSRQSTVGSGQRSVVGDQPVAPASTEEAADAVRAWAAAGTPFFVRGRDAAAGGGAVLSTKNLRGIREYARNDLFVTVGAGTPLADLQAELAHDRVWVPLVSPWRESTLGGIVATNFNAPLRMRYGALRDLILALTVVLPDGRILRAGKPVVKNVAGYDLPKLFVGAYGTLGVITEVTLKVVAQPRARSTLVVPVDDLERGARLGMRLVRVCLVASSLLLCAGSAVPDASARYALIYTAEGMPEDVNTELAQMRRVVAAEGLPEPTPLAPSGNEVWAEWLRAAWREARLARAGVPPKELSGFLNGLAPALSRAAFIADLANGQVCVQYDAVGVVRDAARAVGGYAILLNAQGERADEVWGYTPDGLEWMRGLKARWDAQNLCNPNLFVV